MSSNQDWASFCCPLCGSRGDVRLSREAQGCAACGANARYCGIILALQDVAFDGSRTPLILQPPRMEVSALGISDSECYADLLGRRLSYRNTFFHQAPFLDVCAPASCAAWAASDVIICSDVIEHTAEPPPVVLANLCSMLKPGGSVILSAPTWQMPYSIEWYPGATELTVAERETGRVVEWRNRRGTLYTDDRPNFHGGTGDALERRLLSHSELTTAARAAGFDTVQTVPFAGEYGYVWPLAPWPDPTLRRSVFDSRVLILTR